MTVLDPQLTENLVPEFRHKLSLERKLSAEEECFCDDACLKRYLRARRNDVDKALDKLISSLNWRNSFGVTRFSPDMFCKDMATGKLYPWNGLVEDRSVLILRKKLERITAEEGPQYLRYLVFMLESAIKLLPEGQEKLVLILDLNGYSRQNSPPLSYSLEMLRIFTGHYPERAYKIYLVDAPTIFSVLYTAVYPFIDPVTKEKINFVYSEKYLSGEVTETQDQKGFFKYLDAYKSTFDEEEVKKLVESVWPDSAEVEKDQVGTSSSDDQEDEFYEVSDEM
eukprot:TRINITY_DN6193_c0_g5_i1.p1 TRINITY_DN6193_c0_g5~~TRINITY_DN6193_c0_g5_i1.p1  ORF type:complete len:294 (-),score=25.20 TRINITY_DN6193_c0_g5_i1:371-1213(-)